MSNNSKITKRQWLLLIDAIIFIIIIVLLYFSFNRVTKTDNIKKEPPTTLKEGSAQSHEISLRGIDVSHYQGNVDWPVIADTFHFAFLKATESNDYVDPKFHENIKKIQNTNINFGAYHFFSPETAASGQAENFINNTRTYDFNLPPVIDIEVAPDNDIDAFHYGIQQWLDKVSQSTGCTPIIYSNKSFWNQYLKERFSGYPVWISDYTTNENNIASIPWSFWQFSDQGNIHGISGPVDQSLYRGTENTLKALGNCQA